MEKIIHISAVAVDYGDGHPAAEIVYALAKDGRLYRCGEDGVWAEHSTPDGVVGMDRPELTGESNG